MLEYPKGMFRENYFSPTQSDYNPKKRFEDHRAVRRGYTESKEFEDILNDMINWTSIQDEIPTSDINILETHISKLVASVREAKSLQTNLAEAVYNVRNQYFKAKAAIENNKDLILMKRQELQYDILELEELLVQADLLDPKEVFYQGLESDRIIRAIDIFDDLCQAFHPELISKSHALLFKSIEDKTKGKRRYKNLERSDVLDAEMLGKCLIGLVDISGNKRKDFSERDFQNASLEKTMENLDSDYCNLEKTYTPIWKETKMSMEKILKKYIEPNIDSFSELGLLYLVYPYSKMGFSLKNIMPKIAEICLKDNKWLKEAKLEDLCQVIYGLGLNANRSPEIEKLAKEIVNAMYKNIKDEKEDFHFNKELTLKALWGICNFKQWDNGMTNVLIKNLNQFQIDRPHDDMFFHEVEILRDILVSLKYEAKLKNVLPPIFRCTF